MPRTARLPCSDSPGLVSAAITCVLAVVIAGCAEPASLTDIAPTASATTQPTASAEQVIVRSESKVEHKDVDFYETLNTPGKLVIVDFWATWCGPCRMLAPELEKVAAKLGDDIILLKVNVDQEKDVARNFQINGIPDLRFFRDGQPVGRVVGFLTADQLMEKLPR